MKKIFKANVKDLKKITILKNIVSYIDAMYITSHFLVVPKKDKVTFYAGVGEDRKEIEVKAEVFNEEMTTINGMRMLKVLLVANDSENLTFSNNDNKLIISKSNDFTEIEYTSPTYDPKELEEVMTNR